MVLKQDLEWLPNVSQSRMNPSAIKKGQMDEVIDRLYIMKRNESNFQFQFWFWPSIIYHDRLSPFMSLQLYVFNGLLIFTFLFLFVTSPTFLLAKDSFLTAPPSQWHPKVTLWYLSRESKTLESMYFFLHISFLPEELLPRLLLQVVLHRNIYHLFISFSTNLSPSLKTR